MNIEEYITKQVFNYDGPFISDDNLIGINCKFKIKPKGYITLYWMGNPKKHLDVEVEIIEMTPVSAYMWGNLLKNVEGRLEINNRFWYFTQRLEDIIDNFLENIGRSVKDSSISSVKYTGNIPKNLEYKDVTTEN